MWKHPYVLLILTAMIYAGNLLVGKAITTELPPFTLAFLRFSVALVFMIPLGIKELRRNQSLWKTEWKPLFKMSLLGIVLFNVLVYFSVSHTTSVNAGIIEATGPIFSIILGLILLNEQLTKFQLTGVFLSLIGVIWVISKGSLELITSFSFNIGDLGMCGAMLIWALYSIVVKKHNWKFPVYGSVLLLVFIGVITLFPFALLEWGNLSSVNWSLSILLGVLYVGIFPSVLAFMFWNKAVNDIGPARASVFLNLVPVFTAIGAILFLGESLSFLQALGGIIVLGGVFMTTRKTNVIKVSKTSNSYS